MKRQPNPGERIRQSRMRLIDPLTIAISVLAILLLPFAILSFFSHPQADDFDAAATTMRLGYFKSIASAYTNWNSRWFSSAIMQASPLVFGSIALYKAAPITLFVLFFWALFAFIKAILPEVLRLSEGCLCTLALLALYLSSMPSVVQGFYWIPGAISYQLANVLMLFLWTQLIKVWGAAESKVGKWTLLACSLLLFALIGSNQTSMVLILLMLVAALAWRFLESRKIDWFLAKLIVVAAFAATIVVMAPGNHARLEHVSHAINPAATIKESAMTIYRLAVVQIANPLLLVLTGCAIPFFSAKARNSSAPGPVLNPVALSVLWICCMLVTVIPVVHLFRGWIPERVLNITSLLFIMGWFLILNETIRYLVFKRSFRLVRLPRYAVAILMVFALFSFTGKNNIRIAWKNILSGDACQYDWELRQRYQKIKSCTQDTCAVAPLSVFPSMLYYEDIKADAAAWPNKPCAEYFGKRAIILDKANR
jgi:hypothetical protein